MMKAEHKDESGVRQGSQVNNIYQQQGNALTELFILSLVLVPALVTLPMLGKITDTNQSAVQASRYVAFEKTISGKNTELLTKEVRMRFFADPKLKIATDAEVQPDAVNSFWRITNADGEADSLLRPGSPLSINSNNQSIPNEVVAELSRDIVSSGKFLAKMIPDSDWSLEENGLFVATINSVIKQPGQLPDTMECGDSEDALSCVTRSTAIFVDEWNAGSSNQAEERSRTFVPAAVFRPVGNVLAKIGEIPLLKEMKGLEDAFGKVDSEQVPADRLGPWEDTQ
jgi:hypothetical protein